jgi:hypothetical protein
MQNQASRHTASGLHAGAPHTLIGDVGDIFALVADELIATETQLHDELAMTIPAVAEIGHYLAKSGGKRFRPMLTALGAKAVALRVQRPTCVRSENFYTLGVYSTTMWSTTGKSVGETRPPKGYMAIQRSS